MSRGVTSSWAGRWSMTASIHGPEQPDERTMRAVVREQVEGLLEGGVDLLVFETAWDLDDLLLAIEEARALSDVPIVGSMTFGEDLVAVDGTTPEGPPLWALGAAGVDALGVNCGVGPIACLDALGQMAPTPAGCPAASCPTQACPRVSRASSSTPRARPISRRPCRGSLAAGARLIGGCCGTTPIHVAAMRQALDKELARVRGTEAAIAGRPAQLEWGPRPRSTVVERAGATAPDHHRPPGWPRSSPRAGSSSAWRSTPPRSVRVERTSRRRACWRRPGSTWSTSATGRWPGCA